MIKSEPISRRDAIHGCLIGTAVGDALGLPFEGLSKRRRHRIFGEVKGYRLFLGRGMGSDDIEQTCLVAQAIIRSEGDAEKFQQHLARLLKFWFLCIPLGIGKATALSCIKLLIGFSPKRSGVFSAGNGSAMRSAIIGATLGPDLTLLREFTAASSAITHSDPLAEKASLLVALAASVQSFPEFMGIVHKELSSDAKWYPILCQLEDSIRLGESTSSFAESVASKKGVSGYVLHCVPVALHASFTKSTVIESIISAVECGGDADTTAAIAGGISGARLGSTSMPEIYTKNWMDFPISMEYLEGLASALARYSSGEKSNAPRIKWWIVPFRNLLFLLILIMHLVRRILPPY